MLLFEANQMQADKQADKDSTFAMLVRTLISEGRIVHQTTVEDPNSPTGRRVERIVREGRLRSSPRRRENYTPKMRPACCRGISTKITIRQRLSWPALLTAPPALLLHQLILPSGMICSAGSPLVLTML